ncbi:chemotaxis protein CheW [Heliobacterium mobile]|uniref:chemotaxis protein CheW n=1 Tax=Heliobacterium mobile TaxID=28064 RepID=UPI001478C25B|nr:chemotaxis protein CheW [Heliobacterium mobile]
MDPFQIVTFSLGRESYGIPIERVREIIRPTPITLIPHTPPYVLGLLNLRGNVIPVIDLRLRLHITPEGEAKNNRIIVVEIEGVVVGMMVDSVSSVMTVQEDMLTDTPDMLCETDDGFINRVIKTDQRLTVLLNLQAMVYPKAG